jgi:drug/metabolite transporter (DMT)-like permease
MKLTEERKGEAYIIFGAILWGLFPVITILSFASIPPLISLGWSALIASGFFAAVLTIRGRWKDVFDTAALGDTLLTTFFIGILFYALFFSGLEHTSAGNAGIVELAEIFFSFCLFNLWRKEHFPPTHLMGTLFMLFGACIVLYPSVTSFQVGDFLILTAAFVAPFGNFFQRRARLRISSEGILFVRSLLSAPFIFLFAYILGNDPFRFDFSLSLILLLLVNGVFLFGVTKILWIEAIHRISVTKANALSSISPFLTLCFAYLLLGNIPTPLQLGALLPIFLGILLLSRN